MTKPLPARLLMLCASLLIVNLTFSQDFAWIKGANIVNQSGIYGTLGSPSPGNTPGARQGAASWTDLSGSFWIFGGYGYDHVGNNGYLSDLWKYTPSTNQWTYMHGSTIIAQSSTYSPVGVATPTGMPGSRINPMAWTDVNGNLWLLGGHGFGVGSGLLFLNDLWKYNTSTNQWTFMGGSTTANTSATYGTITVPAASNQPGGRSGAATWVDNGNLWLFGGTGNTTSTLNVGVLNDVWRYNITNNEWTWMKGGNTPNLVGAYGTKGTPSATNTPGGRTMSTGWLMPNGDFWLYGGNGITAYNTSVPAALNDLWKYSTNTNQWSWIGGSDSINKAGVYGLQGISSSTCMPGARFASVSFKDVNNVFWMFGGQGIAGTLSSTTGNLNDLWRYDPSTNVWTWTRGSAVTAQAAIYGSPGVPAQTNTPGGRYGHSAWIDNLSDLYFFGGYGQGTPGSSGYLNDLWKYTNCFVSPITMTITSLDTVICANESTTLTASGSNNYLWLNGLVSSSNLAITPSVTTTYTVFTSDTKGCRYEARFTETVLSCNGISENNANSKAHNLYPNPSQGDFYLQLTNLKASSRLNIYNTLGELLHTQALTEEKSRIHSSLAQGVYHYVLTEENKTVTTGKLIIE